MDTVLLKSGKQEVHKPAKAKEIMVAPECEFPILCFSSPANLVVSFRVSIHFLKTNFV